MGVFSGGSPGSSLAALVALCCSHDERSMLHPSDTFLWTNLRTGGDSRRRCTSCPLPNVLLFHTCSTHPAFESRRRTPNSLLRSSQPNAVGLPCLLAPNRRIAASLQTLQERGDLSCQLLLAVVGSVRIFLLAGTTRLPSPPLKLHVMKRQAPPCSPSLLFRLTAF